MDLSCGTMYPTQNSQITTVLSHITISISRTFSPPDRSGPDPPIPQYLAVSLLTPFLPTTHTLPSACDLDYSSGPTPLPRLGKPEVSKRGLEKGDRGGKGSAQARGIPGSRWVSWGQLSPQQAIWATGSQPQAGGPSSSPLRAQGW